MRFKYNNLSSGYTGKLYEKGTLNSQYYHHLFNLINNNPDLLNHLIVFPQRIPRKGFFSELYELETDEYRNDFDSIIHQITNNHIESFNNLDKNNSENNARQFINWSNILLRHGQFENLIQYFPTNYFGPYNLEIELIKETAKIEILLSNNEPVIIDYLLELIDRFHDDTSTTWIEKIKLLNQSIVYYYRHKNDTDKSHNIYNISKLLKDHIERLENHTFISTYLSSVAYRGLAMVTEFNDESKSEFLNRSITLAKYVKPYTEIEKIASLDNLFTCTQSLAKWYLKSSNPKKAESCLVELTLIDPNDSTGFSEIGFFYINQESYDQAAKYFKKAMQLGPPGTGMNTYYYATCLEKTGDEENAIKYLYQTTEIDKHAVSPWLALLSLYLKNKANDKAREIATQIYNKQNMMEQLEEDEILFIKNIID